MAAQVFASSLHGEQMPRYAIVRNGVVENICLWDGDTKKWQPPAGTVAVNVESIWCDIGATFDGTQFTPSKAPKPAPTKTLEERVAALESKVP